MLSINITPMPWLIRWLSCLFALLAIGLTALPFEVKSLLWLIVMSLMLWTKKTDAICQLRYLVESRQWLIVQADGEVHLARLTASSYASRYIMFLNWQPLTSQHTRHCVLCCWQFNQSLWRQCHMAFLQS